MADRRWSTHFRPALPKAIPLLANLLSGNLLDELCSKGCMDLPHYNILWKRTADEETARELFAILSRKPKPSFTVFCNALLTINGRAGDDLYYCIVDQGKDVAETQSPLADPCQERHGGLRPQSLTCNIYPHRPLLPVDSSGRIYEMTHSKTFSKLGNPSLDVLQKASCVSHNLPQIDKGLCVHVDVTEDLIPWYLRHRYEVEAALKKYLNEAIPKPVKVSELYPREIRGLKIGKVVKMRFMFPNIDRQRFLQQEEVFVDYVTGIMNIKRDDIELVVKDGSCIVAVNVAGAAFINLMKHLGYCGILSVVLKIDAAASVSFGTLPFALVANLARFKSFVIVFITLFYRLHKSARRMEMKRKKNTVQFDLNRIHFSKLTMTKLKQSLDYGLLKSSDFCRKQKDLLRKLQESVTKAKQNALVIKSAFSSLRTNNSTFVYWLATKRFWQSYLLWLKSGLNFDVNFSNKQGESAFMLASRAKGLTSMKKQCYGVKTHVLCHLVNVIGVASFFSIVSTLQNGMTPLMHACASPRSSLIVVAQLIQLGADVSAKDTRNRNVLHMAAESDSSKAVIELLILNGVDTTCKDKEGKAPYHLAKNTAVQTLLQSGRPQQSEAATTSTISYVERTGEQDEYDIVLAKERYLPNQSLSSSLICDEIEEEWDEEKVEAQLYKLVRNYKTPDNGKFFDVFLSYHDSDIAFALELDQKCQENSLSTCMPYRDFVLGNEQYSATEFVIRHACRHTVIILSPNYTRSKFKELEATVFNNLRPAQKINCLIPVIYQKCRIPSLLKRILHIDYTNELHRPIFWERLIDSLRWRL